MLVFPVVRLKRDLGEAVFRGISCVVSVIDDLHIKSFGIRGDEKGRNRKCIHDIVVTDKVARAHEGFTAFSGKPDDETRSRQATIAIVADEVFEKLFDLVRWCAFARASGRDLVERLDSPE